MALMSRSKAQSLAPFPPHLLGFVLSRMTLSAGISLAMLASPDMFHVGVCGGDNDRTRDIGARLDSVISVAMLLTRPFAGQAVDAFGRKPALVLGALASGLARLLAARRPDSMARYFIYRTVNACALGPVMQAAIAFCADSFAGGRASPEFAQFARRLNIGLALVRILAARLAVQSQMSSARTMDLAAKLSLLAGCGFALCTSESLAIDKRLAFSARRAVLSSLGYFTSSRARRAIGLVLCLRALAMYAQGAAAEHRRRAFGWGAEERARLSIAGDVAEIMVPLLVVELGGVDISGERALEWDLRVSALTLLNTAFTPLPGSVLLNPALEMVVQGQRCLNELLAKVRSADDGEGQVEAAMSTLDFPLAVTCPLVYARVSALTSTKIPLLLAALALLVDSEWAVPRAKRICADQAARA
jgi:MFS family permease